MLTTKQKAMFLQPVSYFVEDYYPQKGLFGVELEIEGDSLPKRVEGWIIHEEGSLRGEAAEYVTEGAYDRLTLATALDYLDTAFQSKKSKASDSYRAGVHIHYNMQSRTLDSALRAVIMYTLVEPIFLKLCGKQRDGNLFCLSAYDTGDIHFWLERLYQNHHNPSSRLGRGKYASLNTDPLTRFGTLECRAFPTAWSKDQILFFADLLDDILKEHDMHPKEMLRQAQRETPEFLSKIFGGRELPQAAHSLLGFGVEQVFLLSKIYTEYMGEPND